MRRPIFKKRAARCIYAEEETFKELKVKGIGVSPFFRQAIRAMNEGKFEYDFHSDE